MQDELKLFEKNLTRDLTSFQEHGRVVPRKPRPVPALAASRGIEVRLMVRMKRLSFLDEEFVTVVPSSCNFLQHSPIFYRGNPPLA